METMPPDGRMRLDSVQARLLRTLLAAQYAREDLDDRFGYPPRLRTSIELRFGKPK